MNYETPQTPPKTLAERSAEWRANGGEARLVVAQAEWVEVYKEAEETESARVERMRHLYKERTQAWTLRQSLSGDGSCGRIMYRPNT